MSEPMIHLDRAGCRIGSRWVVSDVTLAVPGGEIFGLVGPNGGGKSLLLAMCATLIRPEAGSLRVGGHDARSEPTRVRRLIGYAPEGIGWHPDLTVSQDLLFFASAHDLARGPRRDAVADALSRWGLRAVAGDPVGRLSRGFLRRLGLARAWVHQPRVLLLDEPVSGLDAESRDVLWTELRRHADGGGSALVASHEVLELARWSHRIGIVAAGRLGGVMESWRFRQMQPDAIRATVSARVGSPA
jgi:ABC-2 type transport system ATP-binding protein